MILSFSLLGSFLAGALLFLALRRRLRPFTPFWPVDAISAALLIAGPALCIYSSKPITDFMGRRHWPVTHAVIKSAKVAGVRAFHPEIVYEYHVHNSTFVDTTDMGVPGFGTRANRLNVAETTVRAYEEGDTIAVTYDPKNPSFSMVHSFPRFSIFIAWISGVGFFAAAVFLLLRRIFIPRRDTALDSDSMAG